MTLAVIAPYYISQLIHARRWPATPGTLNTLASYTQPVLGFLIDDLTHLSSLRVTANSESFTKAALGVMKRSSSLSAAQIAVS